MIKQYFNLTILLCSAWTVYGYCQNDTALPLMAGCTIILSFLMRIRSAESQFAIFKHIPLSVIIIISLIIGWIWGEIIPLPDSASSPFPSMTAAVQSGAIFASLFLYLRPFTEKNLQYLVFCAWLNVAVSINVVFTEPMLFIFCFFCILSTAIFILHTSKKPKQKNRIFRYYRDFILFSALLMISTIGLFYGISRTIVVIDDVFINFANNFNMSRGYTHFLKINSRLNLGPPGRSAFDKRPVLEVTLPQGEGVYLKTQIFDDYVDGVWSEPENVGQKTLPNTLVKGFSESEILMFTSFENIIPSPTGTIAAQGNAVYTQSEDEILYTDDEQRMRILKLSLTTQRPTVELTQDEFDKLTRLPPSIAGELKSISAEIVGDETEIAEQVTLIEDFFHDNFLYSLNNNFKGDDEGILLMIREKRPAYCSYFASAMVLLLRAKGIPSRIAAGFLVTEKVDARKNRFLARVKNAHAWTEVLLPEIDPITGKKVYTWETYDATPYGQLSDAIGNNKIDYRVFIERMWLALLRFNATVENTDKETMKKYLLSALILIMFFINIKKIFAELYKFTHRFTPKITFRFKKLDKLQSIYRCYERYLKAAFNETRDLTDTDGEVINRLRQHREIPNETLAKVESFLYYYHAARFGEKDPLKLKEMIESLEKTPK